MGRLAETMLYAAAKSLYRTQVAQTTDMKQSLADIDSYDRFREQEAEKVMRTLRRYQIDVPGKRVSSDI